MKAVSAEDCVRRDYGTSSFVCVCNATYCDTAPNTSEILPVGQAVVISSSKSATRFSAENVQFGAPSNLNISILQFYILFHIFCVKLR